VPVADVGGLLGDAGMAALYLSPEAVTEPRLAVAAPVASVPELGPGLFHLFPIYAAARAARSARRRRRRLRREGGVAGSKGT
jgi:hypothetical protein